MGAAGGQRLVAKEAPQAVEDLATVGGDARCDLAKSSGEILVSKERDVRK